MDHDGSAGRSGSGYGDRRRARMDDARVYRDQMYYGSSSNTSTSNSNSTTSNSSPSVSPARDRYIPPSHRKTHMGDLAPLSPSSRTEWHRFGTVSPERGAVELAIPHPSSPGPFINKRRGVDERRGTSPYDFDTPFSTDSSRSALFSQPSSPPSGFSTNAPPLPEKLRINWTDAAAISPSLSSFYPRSEKIDYYSIPPPTFVPSRYERATMTRSKSRSKRCWIIGGFLLLVIVAIGAGMGVALSKKNGVSAAAALTTAASAANDGESLSGDTSPDDGFTSLNGAALNPSLPLATSSTTATTVGSRTTGTSVAALPLSTASLPLVGKRLVVFGASYCDNGHARPSKYSGSLASYPYVGGRKSNGPVWVEYLATMLAGKGKIDSRNYAYSGATVDNSALSSPPNVPDTAAQMASFMLDLSNGLVPVMPANSRTLVAIWVGTNTIMPLWNSIVQAGNPSASSYGLPAAIKQLQQTIDTLFAQITSLRTRLTTSSSNGADFLILPLPPLELVPMSLSTSEGSQQVLKILTKAYNSALSSKIAALGAGSAASKIYSYDMTTFYNDIIASPSMIDATTSTRSCVVGSQVCQDPQDYLWFDSLHMTTLFHRQVASTVGMQVLDDWTR